MADLLEPFIRGLNEHRLLPGRGRVVVAVSGGVDSVVLLDLLVRGVAKAQQRVVVSHFNHRLRGRSSDADECFVRTVAKHAGLRCVVGSADVRSNAKRSGVSIEMAARELRHRFLAQTARRASARQIVLAHHADDQVELFFVRLLRGASPGGLAGMRWQSLSPADAKLTLVRPLLGFGKKELLAHARVRGLKFREDRSNRSTKFLRNRIRLELLPLLRRTFQPALDGIVARLMEQLADESALVEEIAAAWMGIGREIAFDTLPAAVQRVVMEWQLVKLGAAPEFELIEALRLHAGIPVTVAPGLSIVRASDGVVRRQLVERLSFSDSEQRIDVTRDGGTQFGRLDLRWKLVPVRDWKRALARRPTNAELLDAEKIGATVVLRHWRPGDRFQAFGMARPTKLQDWFVNRKVPAARRRRLVLAETASGLLCWVEGQRLGEKFKLTAQTRSMLMWKWRKRG
ncbi:MAG TPA: tRNA lysidine(34) synthetase TilS [Verrucomicrobiae bacterium]